jgi:hypothetical protein
MCNAWNHPPGCTCGWGGFGHLGQRGPGGYTHTYSSTAYWSVPPIRAAYESYVNPNASCPVCGAAVFFYQSPYGGKVFFDELGPPWPKHPCTDNTNSTAEPRSITHTATNTVSEKVYRWQADGWQPFFVSSVREIDKFLLEIHGSYRGRLVLLYIQKIIDLSGFGDPIRSDSIAQIRERADGIYELSFITKSAKPNTIHAFAMASQARLTQTSRPNERNTSSQQLRTTSSINRKVGKVSSSKKPRQTKELRQNQTQHLLKGSRNDENTWKPTAGTEASRKGDFVKTSRLISKTSHHETTMALAFAAAFKKPEE